MGLADIPHPRIGGFILTSLAIIALDDQLPEGLEWEGGVCSQLTHPAKCKARCIAGFTALNSKSIAGGFDFQTNLCYFGTVSVPGVVTLSGEKKGYEDLPLCKRNVCIGRERGGYVLSGWGKEKIVVCHRN